MANKLSSIATYKSRGTPFLRFVSWMGCLGSTVGLLACSTIQKTETQTSENANSSRTNSTANSVPLNLGPTVEKLDEVSTTVGMNAQDRYTALDARVVSRLLRLGAQRSQRGLMFKLDDDFFTNERLGFTENAYLFLRNLSDILHLDTRRTVLIEGFVDDLIDERESQDLSEHRSRILRSALVSLGVDGRRISSRGYGRAYPTMDTDSSSVVPNSTWKSSVLSHRRLEVFISDSSGIIASR